MIRQQLECRMKMFARQSFNQLEISGGCSLTQRRGAGQGEDIF